MEQGGGKRGGDGGGVDEQDEDGVREGECSEGEGEGNTEEDDRSAKEPCPPVRTAYPLGGPSLRPAHGDSQHHLSA